MEHSELVAEMSHIEHMSTQERLHLARRRRSHQLKVWTQREKEWSRRAANKERSHKPGIRFSDNVMLLEAASRNDINEGILFGFFYFLFLHFDQLDTIILMCCN